jgi:hypothetical protein
MRDLKNVRTAIALSAILFIAGVVQGETPSSKPPHVVIKFSGPMQVVFNHDKDGCENWDIPDAGARAFRDADGKVHLIDSGTENFAMVGDSLNTVKRVCKGTYKNGGSADPSTFNDLGWLESFYTLDGKTIHALVSHDYHPDRHRIRCGASLNENGAGSVDQCWWSTITQATSTDGGKSFTSPPPGVSRWVAGAPYKFDSDHTGPVGAFVVSNIVPFQGQYYVFVSVGGTHEQQRGVCIMRTATLGVPDSWRAWDGKDFTVQFADPYTTPNLKPKEHVCEPVAPHALKGPVRSLLALENGEGFVATMEGSLTLPDGKRVPTIEMTSSADLIHWAAPKVLLEIPYIGEPDCKNNPTAYRYVYPAMLDACKRRSNTRPHNAA